MPGYSCIHVERWNVGLEINGLLIFICLDISALHRCFCIVTSLDNFEK